MASLPLPRPLRVLLVDDYSVVVETFRRLLCRQGHEVRLAADGPSALAVAASFRPDVVFLDLLVPGLDGFQVAQRLRQLPGLEGTLLAGVTGFGPLQGPHHAGFVAFDHYLPRPLAAEEVTRLLAAQAPQPPATSGPLPAGGKLLVRKTVLVVEDNEVLRAWQASVLRREGCTVVSVAEGEEALAYMRSACPPDVVLLDMLMPGLDGWAFLERCRRDPVLAAVPVIIATSLETASPEWAAALGAAGYLAKPTVPERLLREVWRCCGPLAVPARRCPEGGSP
jgi:CheY-like chemotaxis protein